MIYYILFEIVLFLGIILFAIMQKDYVKRIKLFKHVDRIEKTEIIVDTCIIIICDLFLISVFIYVLFYLTNII